MKSLNNNKKPLDFKNLEVRNEILTLFLSDSDINDLVSKIVNLLGKRLNVDRVFIYHFNKKKSNYKLNIEWVKDYSYTTSSEYIFMPVIPYLHDELVDNRPLEFADSIDLPEGYFREYIISRQIESFTINPIFVDDEFYGIIGFESRYAISDFNDSIKLLRYVSGLLSKAYSKHIMQNKLTNSEKKYKNLFENMSAAFTNCELIYDDKGNPVDYRFLEVNNKFEQMTGIKADKWINHTVKELLPDVEPTILKNAIKVIETGNPLEYESYSIPLNKHYMYSTFKSGENSFAIISNDITEKKQTELALIESEKRYRNLFERMTAGFASHKMIYDEQGNPVDYKFIEVNNKFKEITGMKDEQWVGKTVKEILPQTEDYWIQNYAKVIASGKSIEIENFSKELDKYYHVLAYKTSDSGFATIATDVTHRKKTEQLLFAEKERLKITLESIGDGVITTDISGRITMINYVAEKMTGWKNDEARGKDITKVFDIINETTGQVVKNPAIEALESGEVMELANHTKLRVKDSNEEFIISDSAAPIRDNRGNIFGAILVFRDVTEAKKRNDEIRYLSMHDSLTGLYNRLFFEEKLEQFDNQNLYPLSVIMGDANGLKITNDVFGHNEGDRLLKLISKILCESSRSIDIVARWGGDEFVILMPNGTSKEAKEVCKKINQACNEIEGQLDGYSACPSISLGYATRMSKDKDIHQVVKTAEDLMYKRKLLESKSAHSSIILSMKNTLFEKSHETEEHAVRLSKYCCKLGDELNISQQELYDLELFSVLHDIGKVAIDATILTKTSKLTEAEWYEIRRHPEIGYRIANSVPQLSKVAEYILTHHEKWDGSGYPQGLSGKNIPIQSRILAIIDSFDAMTHDRPYRKALSSKEATDEIINNSGTQFDPDIAKVFLEKIVPTYNVSID